jgi:hypothetical protein
MEKQEVEVSIYLHTRRQKASGKYPVKVRIYHRQDNSRKYYPTEFDFTEQEFESVWLTSKPRNEVKAGRQALQALETKAFQTASSIQPFNFESFEKRLFIGAKETMNIIYHFEQIIADRKKQAHIDNASNYELSLKSIKSFTRFIKQHLKKLAGQEGLTGDVSTYWARHSFATNAIRNGASMELFSELLTYGDLKTTKGYFAGFSDEDKQQIAERLTAF